MDLLEHAQNADANLVGAGAGNLSFAAFEVVLKILPVTRHYKVAEGLSVFGGERAAGHNLRRLGELVASVVGIFDVTILPDACHGLNFLQE